MDGRRDDGPLPEVRDRLRPRLSFRLSHREGVLGPDAALLVLVAAPHPKGGRPGKQNGSRGERRREDETQGTPVAREGGEAHRMIEIKHKETGEVLLRVNANTLEGASLNGANLKGADLRAVVRRKANLRGADLSDADHRDATLADAVLSGDMHDMAYL